jgi:hypothetical protein
MYQRIVLDNTIFFQTIHQRLNNIIDVPAPFIRWTRLYLQFARLLNTGPYIDLCPGKRKPISVILGPVNPARRIPP